LIRLIIPDIGKVSVVGTPSNLGLILEDITSLAEMQIISMYHSWILNQDNEI
jgi:hypothetical protein